MNARYGWGSNYSTDGPSNRYNREFWDAIFSPSDGYTQLGPANHDSKEDNLYRIDESCMRWCYYEIHLFGDPTVSFRGVRSLALNFPEGLPTVVEPGTETTFQVAVSPVGDGQAVSNSGVLHYTLNGGAEQTESMVLIGFDLYEATLPAVDCEDILSYYVSVDEVQNGPVYSPDPTNTITLTVADDIVDVFSDDFQTDLGWTVSGSVSAGDWERGVPVGGGDRGDPANDYDGSGACYLTGNTDGDSDIDDGTTSLTTPMFDLAGVSSATISYARWYCNATGADPNNDVFQIYISNNAGTNWTLVETVGPSEQASGGWNVHSFTVDDIITPTSFMQMRFDASDLSSGSVVEAAIDAFKIEVVECESNLDIDGDGVATIDDNCPETYNPEQEDADEDGIGDACCCVNIRGNMNADEDDKINIADLTYIVDFLFGSPVGPVPGCPAESDCDGDGSTNIADLTALVGYLFDGGNPPAACPSSTR
jgi:hypothetical protein